MNVISAAELYSYIWLKQCISYYVTFTTLKKNFFLRFLHAFSWLHSVFLFTEQYSIVRMCDNLFIHSHTEGQVS